MSIEETKQAIEALPDNGRLFIDAGGRGEVRTGLTTVQIKKLNADHTRLVETLKAEIERREELEVVAAALYLNHSDGHKQFDMYKAVYLEGKDAA